MSIRPLSTVDGGMVYLALVTSEDYTKPGIPVGESL